MRIYLESLGCRLNYAEMAALGRQLVGAGHELAADATGADLCVLNSCAVTGEAARQSRQLARRLARTNPAGRLVVTGCYATLEGEAVAQLPNVVLVVGNRRKDDLLALIQDLGRSQPSHLANTKHPIASRTRAFVKVQDGCRNRCTFCIVTVARGDERSRPVVEVVAEVNALHAEGYQEAVLTGVHLGGYGSDLGDPSTGSELALNEVKGQAPATGRRGELVEPSEPALNAVKGLAPSLHSGQALRQLVTALLEETTIPRLRLSSLEPFDLAPDFFDLWAASAGRLMPHLHLPAQSGSDAVLRRMARRNRVADFEALVATAQAAIPELTVTTDLIVGFPGETEDDFAQTVAFARRVGFAHLHVFPYSARQGTAAARFDGQVPEAERKRRVRVLTELDAELGTAVRTSFIGQTRPVLWESRQEMPPCSPTLRLAPHSPSLCSGQALRSGTSQGRVSGGRNFPQDWGRWGSAGSGHTGFRAAEDTSPQDWGDGGAIWSGLTDNYLRVLTAAPTDVDLHNHITATRLMRGEADALWGEITEQENLI